MPSTIISTAEMRTWEQATWAAGQSEEAVIRKAGAAIASVARAVTRKGDRILVLAGKGHNGDDARLAMEALKERECHLLLVHDPARAQVELSDPLTPPPALIIDGLFGIGLSRPLSSDWVELLKRVNASGCPILSVDTPSGLHADEGTPQPEAIRATWTVTLGAVKKGLIQPAAWAHVGRLLVAPDIGLTPLTTESEMALTQAGDFAGFPPARPLIIAGSMGYHGAAVLAARGAQHARPGLITLYTQEQVYVPVAAQLQSVMVRPWPEDLAIPKRCTAVLVGPGLASADVPESFRAAMGRLWQESPLPMIADASALDWLPQGPNQHAALRVMTPHPGEAGRMLGRNTRDIQKDRVGSLRQLSAQWGDTYVVLKGHHTMSGQHTGRIDINSSGNPGLAQGGSGDVLAGYLSGLLAQPALQRSPAKTVAFAVWQHGASADGLESRQTHWTVEDLAGTLGTAPRVNLII